MPAEKKNVGQTLTNVYKGFWEAIPSKVRNKLGFTRTIQARPNEDAPDAVTTTLIESKVETDRTNERVKTNTTLGSATASFAGQVVTGDKQLGTVMETWDAAPTISVTALTESGEVEDYGNNKLARVVTVAEVFDEKVERVEIPLLVPEQFLSAVPITTTEVTAAGTSTSISLGTGEFSQEKRRVDATKVRTTTRSRGAIGAEQTLSGKKLTTEFGGGVLNVTQTFDETTISIDQGLMVVNSVVNALGDGLFHKISEQLEDASWPILVGTKVDEETGIVVSYTKQVVAAGSTGGVAGNVYTEITPLDKWRSLKVISQISGGLPADEVVENITIPDFNFPAELESAEFYTAEATSGTKQTADVALAVELKQLRGPFTGKLTRKYSMGPPTGLPTAVKYQPHADELPWTFAAYDTEGFISANARTFTIPYCLHGPLTIAAPSVSGSSGSYAIAATTPTSIDSGDIVIRVTPQKWRLGLYVTEILEITL